MSGCRTVNASSTMEYIAFNQHKFASVIENINKELQVKGEGKACYFPLFILLQYTSDKGSTTIRRKTLRRIRHLVE